MEITLHDIKLWRANVNEQTKVVAVEQQIFGEDDPADEICWVAAGMRRLRTDGQQEQILVIVVVGADTTVVVGADTD